MGKLNDIATAIKTELEARSADSSFSQQYTTKLSYNPEEDLQDPDLDGFVVWVNPRSRTRERAARKGTYLRNYGVLIVVQAGVDDDTVGPATVETLSEEIESHLGNFNPLDVPAVSWESEDAIVVGDLNEYEVATSLVLVGYREIEKA